jgi:hypothetical protein
MGHLGSYNKPIEELRFSSQISVVVVIGRNNGSAIPAETQQLK